MRKSNIKLSYEPEADVLRVETGAKPIDHAAEMGNVIVHFSPDGEPVYFEILEAKRFFERAAPLVQRTYKRSVLLTR